VHASTAKVIIVAAGEPLQPQPQRVPATGERTARTCYLDANLARLSEERSWVEHRTILLGQL